jgi:hypothetical protein
MQTDNFPLPEDSELYQAHKWQWEHRDKKSPCVFKNPGNGQKFAQRNKFMRGLCKRSGIKAFRKFEPSVLNDIYRVSIKKLQRLLRHQNQATTEIYLKKIDDDLAVGLRLLEKKDTHLDTQIKKEVSVTDNPRDYLVVPRGVEPLFPT